MHTYIPKQTKLSRERIEAKLEVELIRKLERYCEYLDSERDYVVSQLLQVAFKKDKGFAEWLAQHPADSPERDEQGSTAPEARRSRSAREGAPEKP